MDVLILIPVYNDWNSVRLLLPHLDKALAYGKLQGEVAIIDDGSSTQPPPTLVETSFEAVTACTVVTLRMNLGHQRALAVGLAWAEALRDSPLIAVMDGDGEDTPEDLVRLIESCRGSSPPRIVFAGRTKRSEGRAFRLGYRTYRLLFRLLVGMNINFGNFCVLPRKDLVRLVASADLWNHFAAAVVRSKIPYDVISSTRGTRLDGRSHMNLLSLVTHGLSAVAVFSDRVGVRLLGVTAGLSAAAIAVLGLVVWIKFFTDEAIQGWATNAAGLLVIALMILLTLFLGFSLMVLKGRDAAGFLPLRDYGYYIGEVRSVVPSSSRLAKS